MLSFEDLCSGFKELGVTQGDTLMVHSSFKSFGGVEGGPQTVIDALLHLLGKEGTLVMPTYTLAFCDQFNERGQGIFDVNESPSEMGILSELLRKMPNAKRTIHPIHSVAVVGKKRDFLTDICDKTSFGFQSIFGKLHFLDAKIMIIGLDYDSSLTFFHFVEELYGVNFRYNKNFSGIIKANGKEYVDTFIFYVKNIPTDYNPLGEVLEKKRVVKTMKIGSATIKLVTSNDVFRVVSDEIINKSAFTNLVTKKPK